MCAEEDKHEKSGMSDIWKMIITALVTFTLTAMTLWFAMIKEHQSMCATVESVRTSQSAVWQQVGGLKERVAAVEAREELLHKVQIKKAEENPHGIFGTGPSKPDDGVHRASEKIDPKTSFGFGDPLKK